MKALARVAAGVAVALPLASAGIAAESAGEFFKGKQIRIVVGSATGGGYDIYSRTLAVHLGRHVPGNPSFIVQNQPGAGSIGAANAVYVTLPQDGTVIGAFQPVALFEQFQGNPAIQFETNKFQWLGSMTEEVGIAFIGNQAKVKTFDDLLVDEATFGTSGPNVTEQLSSMLLHMTHARIKQVRGYQSATQIFPAIERGEVDAITMYWGAMKASLPHWLRDKQVNLLVQFGSARAPDMPDVPVVTELFTPKYLRPEFSPDEAMSIWKYMLAQQIMAWPYALGPGVPADRVAVLRKAFIDVTRDPAFIADSEKQRRAVNFVTGERLQALLQEAGRTPKSILEKVAQVTQPK